MKEDYKYLSTNGNCPKCNGELSHHWLDYLGLIEDWFFKCKSCKEEYHTMYGKTESILKAQPHIILKRW